MPFIRKIIKKKIYKLLNDEENKNQCLFEVSTFYLNFNNMFS